MLKAKSPVLLCKLCLCHLKVNILFESWAYSRKAIAFVFLQFSFHGHGLCISSQWTQLLVTKVRNIVSLLMETVKWFHLLIARRQSSKTTQKVKFQAVSCLLQCNGYWHASTDTNSIQLVSEKLTELGIDCLHRHTDRTHLQATVACLNYHVQSSVQCHSWKVLPFAKGADQRIEELRRGHYIPFDDTHQIRLDEQEKTTWVPALLVLPLRLKPVVEIYYSIAPVVSDTRCESRDDDDRTNALPAWRVWPTCNMAVPGAKKTSMYRIAVRVSVQNALSGMKLCVQHSFWNQACKHFHRSVHSKLNVCKKRPWGLAGQE